MGMPLLWSIGAASVWLVSASLPLLGSPEHHLGAVQGGGLLAAPESWNWAVSVQQSRKCYPEPVSRHACLMWTQTASRHKDAHSPWLLLGWAGHARMHGQTHGFSTGVFPGSCRLQRC